METPPLNNTSPIPPGNRSRPRAPIPYFTYLLIGVNVLVFLLQLVSSFFFQIDILEGFGAKSNYWILQGQYWRLLTPIFLHASILHILFNMYALYQIGPQVEHLAGKLRFGAIYFLSGVAGVIASFRFSPSDSIGASGAIFGLIGAFAVYLIRHRKILNPVGRSLLTNILVIIAINIAISFTPMIDYWGHFGGLIAGSLLMYAIGPSIVIEVDEITGVRTVRDTTSKMWSAFFSLCFFAFLIFCVFFPGQIPINLQ